MKTLYILLLPVLVLACNDAGDAPKTTGIDSPISESNKGSTSTGPCSKMIFFQKGAEVEATSYNAEGKEISKQITKILEVRNENGVTVADVEGTDRLNNGEEKPAMHYSYKCDGDKIYFDIASMFRSEKKDGDAGFESSTIEYPINVKEGETLPDVTGVMRSEKDGKTSEMKYHFKDRKVAAKEEITTAAGTWNCYKISNTVEVELNIPGLDENSKRLMKEMQSKTKNETFTWFAPEFGIVKMEMYLNGKLSTRNEVTSIKR